MKLIFDIGANKGEKTDVFITKAEKVICFEPNPDLAKLLKEKYANKNVIVNDVAVSDSIGEKIFSIANVDTISTLEDDWITNSRFSNREYTWDKKITVKTTTLDQIIEEYGIPDYVKIDVEGHEHRVLLPFTKLIPNTIFSFEWSEEHKSKIISILNHVHSLGYDKFAATIIDNLVFEEQLSPYWGSFDMMSRLESLDENRKELFGMIYFKK
jgi:FkbM family methyltransferase